MSNLNVVPDETLDCRGLSCPMPILKTKKTINRMKPGQILEIYSTDAGSRTDLPAFARKTGNEDIGEEDSDGFTRFYIRVG